MQLNLTPYSVPSHWTTAYIGRPWELGAEGPDAFDCWGLAKTLQAERYGRELPSLRVMQANPSPEQTTALLGLMRRGGWSILPDWRQMMDGDLLRMQSPMGPHIGVAVRRHHAQPIAVLHCVGALDLDGVPHGASEMATLAQLVAEGFGQFQAWRFEV